MKNNKPAQQKNFYFALYSSLAAITLVAVIIAHNNLHSLADKFSTASNQITSEKNPDNNQNATQNKQTDEYQTDGSQQNILVQPVSNNLSKSYLTVKNQPNEPAQTKSSKNYLTPTDRQSNINPNVKSKISDETKKSASDILTMPKPLNINNPSTTDSQKSAEQNKSQNEPENQQSSNSQTAKFVSGDQEQSFSSFDESQKMAWPVFGDVVMNFDDKNLVYDKTLEQYRTNDCISLSANVGQQVKASADGIVKLITKTNEGGNTIVIDHGNNWSTTYSQLQDDLLVNEGDIVKKGQAIGGVNKPTKYGVLLGNHLDFKITHDDVSVNPESVMVEK